MIHIKKYMMVVATMGLLCSALIGCTKTEKIYIDDLYQKAYISLGMFPHDYLAYTETVNKGAYQVTDYQLVKADTRTTSGTSPFEFNLFTTYAVKQDLTGTLSVVEDAETFIEEYNEANATEYTLMPEDIYIFNAKTSTIKIGSNKGDEPFSISLNDETEIPDGLYMLPLTCTLNNNKIEMSENKGTFYITVNYKTTFSDGYDEEILPADTEFTVTTSGATVNNVQNLYDGYTNTTCTTSVTSSSSAVITYEFAQPIDLHRIAFVRGGSTQCYMTPAYTYEGESTSTSMTRLTLSSTSPTYTSALPDSDKKVKTVQLTIARASSGGGGPGGNQSSTVTMGEVYFLVKK